MGKSKKFRAIEALFKLVPELAGGSITQPERRYHVSLPPGATYRITLLQVIAVLDVYIGHADPYMAMCKAGEFDRVLHELREVQKREMLS